MFKLHCPRCKSVRIQLGFKEPPTLLKSFGIRELLCNNCGMEFRRFAPSGKRIRSESGETETTPNRRRAPRFKARLRVRLAKASKEQRGAATQYGSELAGYTKDVSRIGLSIVIPEAAAGAHDFLKSGAGFWVWLDLPTGPVKVLLVPVRRERLLAGPEKGHLLIGAHIRGIGEAERKSFHRYIDTLQEQP